MVVVMATNQRELTVVMEAWIFRFLRTVSLLLKHKSLKNAKKIYLII